MPFYLRKWYLDLTSEDGTVIYIYFMATRIAGIPGGNVTAHLRLADGGSLHAALNRRVTLTDAGKSAVCRRNFLVNTAGASHVHLELPQLTMDLHYRSTGRSWSPTVDGVLLRRGDGLLSWEVPQPMAAVDGMMQIGAQQRRVAGTGYQDIVHMTLPPWRLPVAELTWGRAHCGAYTVVFDQLRLTDGACLQFLLLRSEDEAFAPVESNAFTIEAGPDGRDSILRHKNFVLRLTQPRILAEGAIASGGQIPFRPLRRMLAQSSGNPLEKKMTSRADLCMDNHVFTGRAIHERVEWRWKARS